MPEIELSGTISHSLDDLSFFTYSFYPGFLLYFPGNLWGGSTATAYIETNFTDPFEARLSFLHSNEDRQFYGEARIVNGSGVIEFEVQ